MGGYNELTNVEVAGLGKCSYLVGKYKMQLLLCFTCTDYSILLML